MPLTTTDALILRYVDYGESDRIVHLLTPRTGRLAAIAKGARRSQKRFPGTLDLFNLLRVQVDQRRRGGLARLDSARLTRAFQGPRRDPACFALGCYVLELLDRAAPEGGPAADLERLFAFAVGALALLEEGTADRRLRVLLELRTLSALGLRPELERCVRCGKPTDAGDAIRFHVAEGGAVCGNCSREGDTSFSVHRGTLRALARAESLPIAQLRRLSLTGPLLEEADRLVRRFHRFHVGVELRSEPFVDRLR